MISHHDIEAFQADEETAAKLEACDEIIDRSARGVVAMRRATESETLKLMWGFVFWRSVAEAQAKVIAELDRAAIEAGRVSMSLHGNGERKPCSDPSS